MNDMRSTFCTTFCLSGARLYTGFDRTVYCTASQRYKEPTVML